MVQLDEMFKNNKLRIMLLLLMNEIHWRALKQIHSNFSNHFSGKVIIIFVHIYSDFNRNHQSVNEKRIEWSQGLRQGSIMYHLILGCVANSGQLFCFVSTGTNCSDVIQRGYGCGCQANDVMGRMQRHTGCDSNHSEVSTQEIHIIWSQQISFAL